MSNYEEDKARAIAISVALNNSATLAAALVDADSTAGTALSDYATIAATLVPLVLDHHAILPLSAEAAAAVVSDVFPQTVQAPQALTPTQVLNQGPAAIPGAKDPDWLWRDFLGDPSGWYDNRQSKKTPNSSDFASKKFTNDKGFKEGLWLTGKYPLPTWVATELKQRGYIA